MKAVYFLIIIAIVTIFFMIELFQPYIKPLFVALLLTVATGSLNTLINKKVKYNSITTILMTFMLATLFFLPIMYCIFSFVDIFNKVNQDNVVAILIEIRNWINNSINFHSPYVDKMIEEAISKIDIAKGVSNVFSISAYLGKNSVSFIMDMILILIFYFFFTLYYTAVLEFLKKILPIKIEDSKYLFSESSNVMTIVLYSIVLTAILEGCLFGIFISFYGYDGFLFGVLYGFASLIPVVGGVIMWLPISIYEASMNNSLENAVIIGLYSIVIISLIADTFVKPIIIKYINKKMVKTPTKVNEILIFFAIIAGLSSFGFWGMIIGPAMVTFFISIMHLLKKYSDDFNN